MPQALVIRHVHFEDLGAFASSLTEAGYGIRYLEAGLEEIDPHQVAEADLLVVLGGPIGAYQEEIYPFLGPELAAIRTRLAAALPTLGICLGAQLMAIALRAGVAPGPVKEIGWAPVRLTEAGRSSPLRHFEGVPVLHWHGDAFDCPMGAVTLATTDACPHQAFALERYALGIQFHPEADGRGFERWLIGHAAEIAAVPGLSVTTLREEARAFGAAAGEAGQRCVTEWLESLP